MTVRYDRRAFLRRAGVAGAAAVLADGFVPRPAAAEDPQSPFLHGVASGDPLPDGVLLWTRVTPTLASAAGPVEVRWLVAADVAFADVRAEGVVVTDADRDYTVKVDVAGLDPGASYFYVFEALGACSPVGRTKTAPVGAVDRLRLAVVSCSVHGAVYNAYARIADRDDLDAVLHLGDYLYEGKPGGGEIITLADYRTQHAFYKTDPDLQRIHQLYPFITVWDDHEFTNDAWRDGAQNHQPATEGDWPTRKAAAAQAYLEWMPIRATDPSRIYRSLRFGDLADLVMLDTRVEGRDQQTALILSADPRQNDPDRQLLSDTQRIWLYDELSTSAERGTRWRLIGQQVMVAHHSLPGIPDLGGLLEQLGLVDVLEPLLRTGGVALWPDQWDGYVAERDNFFAHLVDDEIGNVVVLTGDYHNAFAHDLTPDPYNPLAYNRGTGEGAIAVEFVTTSITSGGVESVLGGATPLVEAAFPLLNPHVRYLDLTRRGYLLLDVTPDAVQADYWFVDTVTQPSTGEVLGASWRVLDGANRLSPAEAAAADGAAAPARPGAAAGCAGIGTEGSVAPAPADAEAVGAPSAVLPATGGTMSRWFVRGAALAGVAAIARILQRRSETG